MIKKYQRTEFDTTALAVPEQVSVAMNEIAADLREGLLALAVGAGLQVMQSLMEEDVTARAGLAAGMIPSVPRPGTAAGAARSPWVADGCRGPVPGSALSTGRVRCLSRNWARALTLGQTLSFAHTKAPTATNG